MPHAGDIMLVGMDRTDRVGQRGNDIVAAFRANGAGDREQRLHVIHGIHDCETANAVADKSRKVSRMNSGCASSQEMNRMPVVRN